jgi:hypothetical protein
MSEPLTDSELERLQACAWTGDGVTARDTRRLLGEVEALREKLRDIGLRLPLEMGARLRRERDALKAENERLREMVNTGWDEERAEHEDPCIWGPLCPYCEVDALKAKLEASERREEALVAEVACFRRCLWVGHGHRAGLYGDDGEMQCAACAPAWDYKRHDPMTTTHAAFKAARADERRKVAEEIQEAVRSEDFHGAHKRVATWAARFVRKHGGEQARQADREE